MFKEKIHFQGEMCERPLQTEMRIAKLHTKHRHHSLLIQDFSEWRIACFEVEQISCLAAYSNAKKTNPRR